MEMFLFALIFRHTLYAYDLGLPLVRAGAEVVAQHLVQHPIQIDTTFICMRNPIFKREMINYDKLKIV